MTDFDFDHIDNEQESHQDELEGFRAVEAIYKELLDHARQRIAELEAKPKDDPIHQQESQRYMVHLWNTSATGIECGIEAGTVVSKSRIAEVDCAECITSLNSQPEHWCDKHQSVFSYNVVYGIRHYVCTQCFVDQPATKPVEAPEGLRAVEAFYKDQEKQAGEYRSHLEAELLQAQTRMAEIEKHAHVLINGGMASKEWSRAERQMRKLLEERSK